MSRGIFTLIFAMFCHLLWADNIDYNYRLTSSAGGFVGDGDIFIEQGRGDSNGQYAITAEYGTTIIITAEGSVPAHILLQDDTTINVVMKPSESISEKGRIPKALKSKYEMPIYVIDNQYIPHFNPQNYTDDMVAEVVTTNKWNKQTKALFAQTEIDDIDVAKRGVVMVTTDGSVKFNKPKCEALYNLTITDSKGRAIDKAIIHTRRGTSDKVGLIKFSAEPGLSAVVIAPMHERDIFILPEYKTQTVTMVRKSEVLNKAITMPSFNGGDLIAFHKWLVVNIRDEISQCREDYSTSVGVKFTVGTSGKVICVDIVKQNNPRAARIVKNTIYRSPLWTPGMQNGKPMRLSYYIPVTIPGKLF